MLKLVWDVNSPSPPFSWAPCRSWKVESAQDVSVGGNGETEHRVVKMSWCQCSLTGDGWQQPGQGGRPSVCGWQSPRVAGSCSSEQQWVTRFLWGEEGRADTELLCFSLLNLYCWAFRISWKQEPSRNPKWCSLVPPAQRVKNHLCWLREDLLSCSTRRERMKVGVKKRGFNCASSTADGGKELRTEQEPAAAATADPGQTLVLQQGWCGHPPLPVTCALSWLPEQHQTGDIWPLASQVPGCYLQGPACIYESYMELPFCCNNLRVSAGCFSAGCALCCWLLTSSVSWFDVSDWNPSELNGSLWEASCYFLW